METALEPDELLTEARLPLLPADTRFGFAEFSRRAGDYALAMALAVLEIDGGVIAAARIGLGGVEAVPRRIAAAEAMLAEQCRARRYSTRRPPRPRAAIEPLRRPADRRAIPSRIGRCDGLSRADARLPASGARR